DQFEKARQRQGAHDFSEGGYTYSGDNDADFSDFFESLFGRSAGGSRRHQTKFRGQDYNAELRLSLSDAYHTHKQTLTVNGKNVRITIPAGIENGQTIKITGHGGVGANGGPAGDLYIKFL